MGRCSGVSSAASLQQKLSDGAYLDLPPHVAEPGPFVSSHFLLQIISRLLVLLLFFLPHPSFWNYKMIWEKGVFVCQPAMFTGTKCVLSPLFTRESFPSDVFVVFSRLSIISDTEPWRNENYKCSSDIFIWQIKQISSDSSLWKLQRTGKELFWH